MSVSDEDPVSITAVKENMEHKLEKRTQDTDLAIFPCALNPFTKNLRFLKDALQTKARELLDQQCLEL